MKHNEAHFTGHNETRLYYQSWHPQPPQKATLVLVHGLGEHSGRYTNVINRLQPAGY